MDAWRYYSCEPGQSPFFWDVSYKRLGLVGLQIVWDVLLVTSAGCADYHFNGPIKPQWALSSTHKAVHSSRHCFCFVTSLILTSFVTFHIGFTKMSRIFASTFRLWGGTTGVSDQGGWGRAAAKVCRIITNPTLSPDPRCWVHRFARQQKGKQNREGRNDSFPDTVDATRMWAQHGDKSS